MKIFLIIFGSYILLKLIMLIFPWGRWLAREYKIYIIFKSYSLQVIQLLDSIKTFSKQLKRKKERRKKALSSVLKEIVLDLIKIIFHPLLFILFTFLEYICEIIFCIISKKERDRYSAQERERNSNGKYKTIFMLFLI